MYRPESRHEDTAPPSAPSGPPSAPPGPSIDVPRYSFGKSAEDTSGLSVEDSVLIQVRYLLKQIPSLSEHLTVTLEDERRILCIGYLGNFAAFGIDPSGSVVLKYMVAQNDPATPFSFAPYVSILQTLLNRYAIRSDDAKKPGLRRANIIKTIKTIKTSRRLRLRKSTLKNAH